LFGVCGFVGLKVAFFYYICHFLLKFGLFCGPAVFSNTSKIIKSAAPMSRK
jgi:hypothetical protein